MQFIEKTMEIWRVELKAGGKGLAGVKIPRGIFQGDAQSPLLFVIAMMPPNYILRKCTASVNCKIDHLMYMDSIKLFAKSWKELEALILTVRIYSQDIGIGFGWEKCAMLVMKSEKRGMTEGIKVPNQEKLRTLEEKKTYKYLGILEADTIKQVEIKEKKLKRISPENQKTTRDQTRLQEPYQRNKYLSCPLREILETIQEVKKFQVSW